jgi:hypothetical protein
VPCHDQGLDRDRDQERLPKGRLFRLRRVTWKQSKVAPSPSNQGCLLLVWPLLRRGSLTPTTLRVPAPNGHPCPDGALAASMRLDPLCVVYVQPAPKSRLAVFGLFAYEDQEQKQIKSKSRSRAKADQEQKQIKGFPAEAGPTVEVSLTFERAHALRGYASLDALRPSAADGGC